MFLSSEGLFGALSDWSMDEWEGICKFGSCRGREEAFEMAHDHHGPWPACTDSYNRRCDFRNVDDFLWI